jgi:hypothetical protein
MVETVRISRNFVQDSKVGGAGDFGSGCSWYRDPGAGRSLVKIKRDSGSNYGTRLELILHGVRASHVMIRCPNSAGENVDSGCFARFGDDMVHEVGMQAKVMLY